MNTPLQTLRRLLRQAGRALGRNLPYLLAADPARPPPAAFWLAVLRPEAPAEHPAGPAGAPDLPAPAACCCGCG